jgi:hypothetical protein
LNFGTPIGSPSQAGLYGNGTLWTVVPTPGGFRRNPRTGMFETKVPWFRARRGLVTITATPRDGPPARFRATVGTPQEYGPTGFAPSGLAFGKTGCWQLHGQLAGSVLNLVLNVGR